jgi:hypothetical protein
MKTSRLPRALCVAFSASLLLALSACVAPTPPRPVVAYPVSYNVQIGNTQVTSTAGPQSLVASATQDVAVEPGKTLYYQVVSPVDVTLSLYELPRSSSSYTPPRAAQLQGTTFTSSITPSTSRVRFTFAASQANSSGTLQFTLSDRPIAPAVTGNNATTGF